MNMACILFNLNPIEALHGITTNAAKALGIFNKTGSLSIGKSADFVVWDVDSLLQLVYEIEMHSPSTVVFQGRINNI